MMMKKPLRLRPGSRIRLVALGFPFKKEYLKRGKEFLESWGLEVTYDKSISRTDFLFASDDATRLRTFKNAVEDPDVDAIWCLRGGYGAPRLMPEIMKWKAPKKPKIIVGYSDVTALHIAVLQKWNWVCIHGSMATRLGSPEQPMRERKIMHDLVFDPSFRLSVNRGLKTLGKSSPAEGELVGGNLKLLEVSLATTWELDTRGKILFLEDVGERAYSIDRMLNHLEQAGKFDHVKGVILGQFSECGEPNGKKPMWKEVFKRFFSGAPFPVITGFPSGHEMEINLPLALGTKVRISCRNGKGSFEQIDGAVES